MDLDVRRVLITLSFIAIGILFLAVPSVQQFGRRLLSSSERITVPVAPEGAGPPAPPEEVSMDLVTVLGFDAIAAILQPRFVSPAEAEPWMEPQEQVLGVSIDGESRAYPITVLSRHEIVNDVVGGVPIAVTW